MLYVILNKMCFTIFSPKISQELLQTTLKFILHFFHWELYHKNQVYGSHHAPSNTFHKSVIILSYLHIDPESTLIFKNITSVANLESLAKFEFTNQNLLRIKLL